ncbi:MAG: (Fe-S)-binding protein [Gammaproteobacteria bacterium]|jgi:L-lactate dehydrogenase complex protein LldE|nr:(Fe-S)-binding protein [Gammaproteobacteria bacterium]
MSSTVGLLVTCLADLYRPQAGIATVQLLEEAGFRVVFPDQTCCGQPGYNAGDRDSARAIAQRVIAAFEGCEAIVAPSGSCTGMLRLHYPQLFRDDLSWQGKATEFAARSFELLEFLDLHAPELAPPPFPFRTAWHESCSNLRELNRGGAGPRWLKRIPELELCAAGDPEVCCGFGGSFAVKFADISGRMVDDKARGFEEAGAEALVGNDIGCLLNIAGRAHRRGYPLRVHHVAELLAGTAADDPGLGGVR